MKRVYHPYWLWEDYRAGLYKLPGRQSEEEIEAAAAKAKALLSDPERFKQIGLEVVTNWPHAAALNLSNAGRNRQAWVGQASVCYLYQIPEWITKIGWHLMGPDQQKEANLVADEVIERWENHGQTLLR